MDECINRNKAINAIKNLESSMPAKDNYAKGYDAGLGRALIAVREVPPSADVQSVKHGRWIKCDYKRLDDAGEVQTYIGQGVYCSKCRTGFHRNEVKSWIGCPCCLARMDGDSE